MSLSEYRRKRLFGRSPEPPGQQQRRPSGGRSRQPPCFVIQHHTARSDYFNLCLEIDGVLVSWAIPQGPSTSPKDRGMARRTEDHPLEHADNTGFIVWDHGTYANRTAHEMTECLGRGHLSFRLDGEKLRGGYALTRIREGADETWLLMTRSDNDADAQRNQVRSEPESVLSGGTLDEM